MRNSLRRILLALLIAAGVMVAPASSAYACRCVPATARAQMNSSDAVFTGRLVKVETRSGDGAHRAEWYERVFTFQVGRVYKGVVASVAEVASLSGEASCGLDLHGDGPFVVFADVTGAPPGQPRYFSDSCTGTGRVSANHPVPAGLGAAGPPGDLPAQPTGGRAVAVGTTALAEDADASTSASPRLVAATLLVLAGAALALLWRLRRSADW